MTTREYLGQLRIMKNKIDRKEEDLAQLECRSTSIGGNNFGEKVMSSPQNDRIGRIASEIIDLENEINADLDRYFKLKKEIVSQLEKIDHMDYFNVLHMRYIQFKTYDEIGEKIERSKRHVINLHAQAILDFEEKNEKLVEKLKNN